MSGGSCVRCLGTGVVRWLEVRGVFGEPRQPIAVTCDACNGTGHAR